MARSPNGVHAHTQVTHTVGWLRQARNLVYFYLDKKGVTQQELAENIGMSVVASAYIETGKRWARLGTLNKIANSLKGNVADLFKGII